MARHRHDTRATATGSAEVKPLVQGLLAVAISTLNAQEAPRFAVNVEGVQVDVQVTRRGRPVAGLDARDFELRDNGVLQRIESVTRDDVPLDLFLVLDASTSVAGEPLQALSDAARIAVHAVGPSDRVALLTFTHRVNEAAPLTSDHAIVLQAIGAMKASGATALVDAIYATLVLRAESKRRGLILSFTDGYDTSSWLMPSAVLDVATQTDAVIYGVTLAPAAPAPPITLARTGAELAAGAIPIFAAPRPYQPPAFLDEISTLTGGRVFHTSSPAKLRALFEQAVREMKSRYVLSYTPQGVARDGWHALDIKLARRAGEVTARRGYFVPPAK